MTDANVRPFRNDGGFSAIPASDKPAWNTAEWPPLDPTLCNESGMSACAFPLEHLTPGWRQWVADTAQSAGTSPDYVVMGLFAAVAALCGAGVSVKVTPAWHEPMVLWLALVGSPSSGKSPALASVRAQLGQIEMALREEDGAREATHAAKVEAARLSLEQWQDECQTAQKSGSPFPPRPQEASFSQPFVPAQLIVADATMEALSDVVAGNPRGVILWRDELAAWLANLGRYASGGSDRAHWLEAWAAAGVTINRRSRSGPLHLEKFPVSVVGSIQPDRLTEAFAGSDDGMAARFLFAWPAATPYTSLKERHIPDDDGALAMLQAIARIAGTIETPRVLAFEEEALDLYDTFLGKYLHPEAAAAEGFEEGWLGKGRGTVARLAGLLTLLDWSERANEEAPRTVHKQAVHRAILIWGDYFRAHAQAIFNQSGRSDLDRVLRRVVKWLRAERSRTVSREDIRRHALSQTVTAEEAGIVIEHLEEAGILRAAATDPDKRGRPAKRWDVNPAVRET